MRLGTATQIAIGVKNISESFNVYSKLGFHKIADGTQPSTWMQISDGSLLILLNQDGKKYMGLTYLAKDMDQTVAELEKEGIELTEVFMQRNTFLQGIFFSPEGVGITLINFDPKHLYQPKGKILRHLAESDFSDASQYPNPRIGIFGEFSTPVADLQESLDFWNKIGFESLSVNDAPYPWAIVSDGLNTVGLHQTKEFTYPAITYFAPDMQSRIEKLKAQGVKNLRGFGADGIHFKNAVLTTPEGEHFFLFSI